MAMEKIKIMTDSGSDLPREIEEQYNVRVLSFGLAVDGESYSDRIDFTNEEWYDVLKKSTRIPTHSQYTPMQFEEEYERFYKEGYTALIYVGINAKGSNTFQNSVQARESFYEAHPEAKETFTIYNVNSGTYSLGYGYPTAEAAKKAAKGVPAREIVSYLEDWFASGMVYFTPYTLEYVKKSGRVSAAAALVGGLMGIKPVIAFVDGESKVIEKVRGDKAVIASLLKIAKAKMIPYTPYAIITGCNPETAKPLIEEMEKFTGYPPAMVGGIGAVISINAGPDVVGLVIKQKP